MPKYYQLSRVHGSWTGPIIHEVMIDYLQEKKITFGTWKQTYVDKNGVRPGTRRVSVGK